LSSTIRNTAARVSATRRRPPAAPISPPVARGAGIEHAVAIRELDDFKTEGAGALEQNGLRFVVCKIEETVGHREIVRSNVDLLETKYRFVRYLERTEGKAIFAGRG
jgi:hypothetical protein